MFKNITLLFSFFIGLFISSCSIQKRVYTNGYHITWNTKQKSFNNSSKELLTETKVTYNSENEIEQVQPELEQISNDPIEITTNSFINQTIEKPTTKSLIRKTSEKENLQQLKNISSHPLKKNLKTQSEKNPDAEINGFGLASFILGALSLLFLFTGIIGLVFAVISLRQFKNNPGKYSNKWMAIVGLITGEIVCIACALLTLIFAVFGGVIWVYTGLLFLMAIIASLVIVNLPVSNS